LLSKDGSKLIVEKDISGGKFFLYSPDGKHRLVSHSGSVHSVAISPDGQYFGSNFDDSVFIKKISDGEYLRAFFVRRSEEWEESVKKMPYIRLLPRIPSMTINCK
jgi:WD40 repeat protein